MVCRREGNLRSGISPAMPHRPCGISTLGLKDLIGDDHLQSFCRIMQFAITKKLATFPSTVIKLIINTNRFFVVCMV